MNRPGKNSINFKSLSPGSSIVSMDKRAFERIQKSIFVKFLNGKSEYTGIIMNLSEKGMFISSKVTFPLKPKLEILIPLKEEILKVHGRIKSVGKAGKVYNGVGVELLSPAQNYLDFINSLRSAL